MSKLVLKKFTCIEETDEAGSDSPYFVVFIGKPGGKPVSDVKTVRKDSWDNAVGSGTTVNANMTIAENIDPNTLVLVAMLEEDVNPDIVGADLDNVRNWMKSQFNKFGSILGASTAQLSSFMLPQFVSALNTSLSNDDFIAVRRLNIPAPGTAMPSVKFAGDGGIYSAQFALA